jgi:hypothetical protein
MKKASLFGVAILLVILLSIPISIYTSYFTQPPEEDTQAVLDFILRFSSQYEELVDEWSRSTSEYDTIPHIIAKIHVLSGVVNIKGADEGVLYDVKAYSKIGLFTGRSEPRVNVKEFLYEDALILIIRIESGFIDIQLSTDTLWKLDVEMTSGVADINLDSLDDTTVNIGVSSGLVNMDIDYKYMHNTPVNLLLSSGVLNVNIHPPSGVHPSVHGAVYSGVVSVEYYGASKSYFSDFDISGDEASAVYIVIESGYCDMSISFKE